MDITPLDTMRPADASRSAAMVFTVANGAAWTPAAGDEVPSPTSPQELDALETVLNLAARIYLGGLMATDDELGPLVTSFGGRIHFNLSQLRRISRLAGGEPALARVTALLGEDDEPPSRLTVARLRPTLDLIRLRWKRIRVASAIRRYEQGAQLCLARLAAADPRLLSDFEVWSVIEQTFADAPACIATLFLLEDVCVHDRRAGIMRATAPHEIWRAHVRSDTERVLDRLRVWHLALAERFVKRGWLSSRDDYFLLRLCEIAPVVNGQRSAETLRALAAGRVALTR